MKEMNPENRICIELIPNMNNRIQAIRQKVQDTLKKNSDQKAACGIEAHTKLRAIRLGLIPLSQNCNTDEIEEMVEGITDLNKTILKDCLGFDITRGA